MISITQINNLIVKFIFKSFFYNNPNINNMLLIDYQLNENNFLFIFSYKNGNPSFCYVLFFGLNHTCISVSFFVGCYDYVSSRPQSNSLPI